MSWTIVLWAALALLVLDATLGRWLLGKLSSTFRVTNQPGGSPGSGRLLVYLPGTLFDGDESVAEVKSALLKHFERAYFFSYGFKRFKAKRFVARAAEYIGEPARTGCSSIVLLGASFGGKTAAQLAEHLVVHYGWDRTSVVLEGEQSFGSIERIVMADTPCQTDTFKFPGALVSRVLSKLYIGPLVSLLALPVTKLLLVPPFDDEIEDGLSKQEVRAKVVRRMARFWLSSVADQQRYLGNDNLQWLEPLAGKKIAYLWCSWRNIAVNQPAAMNKIRTLSHVGRADFTWQTVESPHCGFAQLPTVWSEAFNEVLAPEVPSHTHHYN